MWVLGGSSTRVERQFTLQLSLQLLVNMFSHQHGFSYFLFPLKIQMWRTLNKIIICICFFALLKEYLDLKNENTCHPGWSIWLFCCIWTQANISALNDHLCDYIVTTTHSNLYFSNMWYSSEGVLILYLQSLSGMFMKPSIRIYYYYNNLI